MFKLKWVKIYSFKSWNAREDRFPEDYREERAEKVAMTCPRHPQDSGMKGLGVLYS